MHCARALIVLYLHLGCVAALSAGQNAHHPNGSEVLAAIGELRVPTIHYENGYRRHYDERCSATLVTVKAANESRWALTAWHCLEYYRDLSRSIHFHHRNGSSVEAVAVRSGGSMRDDWALLRLERPLPGAALLQSQPINMGAPLSMAGFSRTVERDTTPLSLDGNCQVTVLSGRDVGTNCHARRGASGGAVFMQVAQASRGLEAPAPGSGQREHVANETAAIASGSELSYVGVISRGDSQERSYFVPLDEILPAIAAYLGAPPAAEAGSPAHPPHDR